MEIKKLLKSLTLIHTLLVVGLIIFTVFVLLQNKGFNAFTDDSNIFLYIVPIASLVGYFGSQLVFKKMLANINSSEPLEAKLAQYQKASLIKFALLEAPTLISLFAYYNSGNALPLVIALCLVAYLIVQKPSKNHIINSLSLTKEERQIIEQI